jgi:hypothetical protein
MIDPFAEQTVPLGRAARFVPSLRGDRPVNPSTIWRWATAGVRGIKLETVKVGGTTCTSREALQRFFARLNGQPVPRPASEDRRQEGVERQLDAKIGRPRTGRRKAEPVAG